MTTYDYILVGGGTAGCVLAARLTQNPDVRVLLVEAGAATGPELMSVPGAWPALFGSSVDWAFTTTPQRELDGASVAIPRGKVLGGSSAVNAMVHIRGSREDYQGWEEQGATGWGHEALLPYLKASEAAGGDLPRDPALRGTDGPMKVAPATPVSPLVQAFLDAAVDEGYDFNPDVNGTSAEGAVRFDLNIVEGVRQSTYDAYLKPVLDRPNLTVITDALVRRVLIDQGRACGVEFTLDGMTRQVSCTSEVVLSAGVFGTPQLLMLSGVGPAAHLKDHGIAAVVDLPGVGENLQDHPFCGIVYTTDEPVMGAHNHSEATVKLRSRQGLRGPDVELLLVDVPYSPNPENAPASGFTIMAALISPLSRGNVRLASADPADPLLIDPRYFGEPEDWEAMLHGMAKAAELGGNKALQALATPGTTASVDGRDAEAAKAYVRRNTATYCHSSGTCRMGTDAMAVVDPALRVHGLEGLRVVDASVMPRLPAANSNATVLAIAERASDLILASREQ